MVLYNNFSKTQISSVLNVPWDSLPELTKIKFRVNSSQLTDLSGNSLAFDIFITFTTGIKDIRYPITDTSQNLCYNSKHNVVPCIDKGQDGFYTNTPNVKRFINPQINGSFPNDFYTIDQVTGLYWQSCTEGKSGYNCLNGQDAIKTWAEAFAICHQLNNKHQNKGFAGRKNWRLPTIYELELIADYSHTNPSIDQIKFPETRNYSYWTSSTRLANTNQSWVVSFNSGKAGFENKKRTRYIRCVSSGPIQYESNFISKPNGTVYDNVGGLTWLKCPAGNNYTMSNCTEQSEPKNWLGAIQYCESLEYAEKTDWRLPNINEIRSLIARGRTQPLINSSLFPHIATPLFFWTSTTYEKTPQLGWGINFTSGEEVLTLKLLENKVFCVKSGF